MERYISRAKPSEFQKAHRGLGNGPARNEIQHAWLVKAVGKRDSEWHQAVTRTLSKFACRRGLVFWLLGTYVHDVKRVLELIHNLYPPLPIRLKLAVQTLQGPASYDRRFMPGGMFIRQFLAHQIGFGAVVVDVEKVPRHGRGSRDA